MNVPSFSKLAYLTGEYPKASHTFILREITGLRALGAEVLSHSIRRPSADNLIGAEEVAAADETFFVLEAAKNPLVLLRAHLAMMRRPGCWLRALGLALRTGRPGFKGFVKQIFYFLEAGVLADRLQREGVTHLHNHFADSSANVAMLTGALADIPFSFTLHGPAELFEPESWHLREKIARAAFTVCISDFARSQAMLFSNPEDWPRLKIVHCGIDPALYAEAPEPSAEGPLNLLFVGRLTAIKGLRVLFEALDLLADRDVTLTLVGDGEDRAFAERKAARLGNITLLGFQSQSEVAAALAKADALVLPSFAEGVPVVLMEAMASGRPVIATRVGGVAELVEDGVSGFLVPPGNAAALAAAITKLAEAPDLRQAFGKAGRKKVRQDFDIHQEAARLMTLFSGKASETRPSPIESA